MKKLSIILGVLFALPTCAEVSVKEGYHVQFINDTSQEIRFTEVDAKIAAKHGHLGFKEVILPQIVVLKPHKNKSIQVETPHQHWQKYLHVSARIDEKSTTGKWPTLKKVALVSQQNVKFGEEGVELTATTGPHGLTWNGSPLKHVKRIKRQK